MGILVIGVVGPSGIGKSSIARGVAANIGARYTELERVEYFTTKSSPSYASRDAVSETPSNIDWDVLWSTPGHSSCIHFCRVPGFEDLMLYTCQQAVVADLVNVIKHESDLCEADPAAATRTIVVDHYLLLACPRLASFIDFVVFLSPFKDGTSTVDFLGDFWKIVASSFRVGCKVAIYVSVPTFSVRSAIVFDPVAFAEYSYHVRVCASIRACR
eukprot:m.1253206 g.1253206  ORF g.1253206 m.1253206 type:complete len:215 (+) comp24704_c1_seq13:245-889(+)